MITFINFDENEPNLVFKLLYKQAEKHNQKHVEAACISSFDHITNEVEARYVNIKYIKNDQWIFFSNYDSPKSQQFSNHNQISVIFFWPNIASQIRIKAIIKKIPKKDNDDYFAQRDLKKNAVALSSNQSMKISSYDQVIQRYSDCLNERSLQKCPDNWGGFAFTPYYYEFWEGHESRLNKRKVFEKTDGVWRHSFLQP